jgi:alpha-glucuronidase
MNTEDGYDLWLRYAPPVSGARYDMLSSAAHVVGDSPVMASIRAEFARALPQLLGRPAKVVHVLPSSGWNPEDGVSIIAGKYADISHRYAVTLPGVMPANDGYRIVSINGGRTVCVTADTDAGVLYGAFHFLRLLQTGSPIDALDILERPAIRWRMLNHWDNPDGSIERGYAGKSLWKWDDLPGSVDLRYADYARACASIGINASVLNNVNTVPQILLGENIAKVVAIANVLRRYAIRTFLSVNFGSPMSVGGLDTADPCDSRVAEWWKAKADEIYALIPDFGGFLVKADSEGQPGPFAYGRSHADGANMLARALEPHGGIVVWRAFVYGHGESDRAKKAYANFRPLDGAFAANAAIQVKNGPIDFQPREPVHPLFGGMERTPVFMEFQVAQEYLGQGNHLVYLAPMWKEILEFDTMANGDGSFVGRLLSTDFAPDGFSGIAAVANTGDDRNWCGHFFHAANWFAYGRLAWDWKLDAADIAREWIACTWGADSASSSVILNIMMGSWEACVDYMTPLGLHHIMKEGHHYGPDPGDVSAPREDWRPTYYHRADRAGLGFNRTRSGSGAVDQYHKPVADTFNDIDTCPEKYLLWFHHVPWNRVLSSGRTLRDEIPYRYARGVAAVGGMRRDWASLEAKIDGFRFRAVCDKLDRQVADAREWESVCVPYFSSFTEYRNLLAEYGYPEAAIEARVSEAWRTIFEGSAAERFYFDAEGDTGYMMDTGNNDARTEGLSYGMMMAVQMNRRDVFDRLWKWAVKNMYMTDGPHAGYFAWSCQTDGRKNADGPAPDGEEYFALALFFASHRWGDGAGPLEYSRWARDILRTCVHRGEDGDGVPMWNPENYQIKFVPGLEFTDPSYHLPHFYDLFALWAYPEDREFWKKAARASREFLPRTCDPATGLASEYANYDGSPNWWNGHGNFYSDSYRVAANIGLDALWSGGSAPLGRIAENVATFFDTVKPADFRMYRISGEPLDEPALHPVGLIATNAMGALSFSGPVAERAVRRFWETPLRTGDRRYYDNCLYFFALLALSGKYRIW